MSDTAKKPATRAFYVEVKRFDGKYTPQVWWQDSKPADKSPSGGHRDIRNVNELDEKQAQKSIEQLYGEFNAEGRNE